MKIVNVLRLASAAVLLAFGSAAQAQSSSYTPGTVWTFTNVQVEPGQFENYLDYLDHEFKKINDFGIKEGYLVSYHVFSVNNTRAGEPDVILAIESRDYLTNAQQLEIQKKTEAFLAKDNRKLTTEFGDRKAIRKILGGMELQELKLK
jgi:hypothetical protein